MEKAYTMAEEPYTRIYARIDLEKYGGDARKSSGKNEDDRRG